MLRRFFVWLVLFWPLQVLAQQPVPIALADSLNAQPVYSPEQLYDLSLLDSGVFEARYTHNPFGHYNPLSAPLHLLPQRIDERIFASMLQRNGQSDIYAILLMLTLLVLVVIMQRNQQYVRNMFQALFNWRLAVQFAREQVANRTLISLMYVVLFNLLLALFLAEWVIGRMPVWSHGEQYLIIFATFIGVTAVYLFKYFFYKLLGVLLAMRESASFYLVETFLINRTLAFLLLPSMAALFFMPAYLPWVRITVLVLLGLGIIWRYVNAIRFMYTAASAHVLHFILYFCAVEIIPTAVIAKFLLNV